MQNFSSLKTVKLTIPVAGKPLLLEGVQRKRQRKGSLK